MPRGVEGTTKLQGVRHFGDVWEVDELLNARTCMLDSSENRLCLRPTHFQMAGTTLGLTSGSHYARGRHRAQESKPCGPPESP